MPAALLDGRIYITGGFGDDRRVLATVEVYDPQSNSWSSAPAMPGPRHHHGVVAANGKLYVIGGYSTLGAGWIVESTLFEFDPATESWTSRAPMPQAQGAMAAASVGGKVYLFGGAVAGREWDHTFIYDPATDQWSLGARMPTAREHVAAVAIGSTIYVAGGRTLSGTNFGVLEAYSPETDSWRSLNPMSVRRSGHGIAAMGGKLYVFGGEDLQTNAVISQVEEYDPQSDSWREVASLPVPLTGPGVVALTNGIHVVGGSDASGATQAGHLVFRLP